jgi:hypothetical protein
MEKDGNFDIFVGQLDNFNVNLNCEVGPKVLQDF